MNCRLKLATQSERRVRVGNLFLLGVEGAADASCTRTTLASELRGLGAAVASCTRGLWKQQKQ